MKTFLLWLWPPDYDDPAARSTKVVAADHESAVKLWAKSRDRQGDYEIVGGLVSPTVMVREAAPGCPVYAYRVSGKPVPQYCAEHIQDAVQ